MSTVLDAWRRAPAALAFATVGGLGYLPGAPGTFGTLAAIPILWHLQYLSPGVRLSGLAVVTLLSMGICHRAGRALGEPDSQRIVLDETIGMSATLAWCPSLDWGTVIVGVIAFRGFDIFKGPLARDLEAHHPNGFGVVADDGLAALWAFPPTWLAWWC